MDYKVELNESRLKEFYEIMENDMDIEEFWEDIINSSCWDYDLFDEESALQKYVNRINKMADENIVDF